MILTGNKIKKEINNKRIMIIPYDPNQISTNSYDLRLSNELIIYTNDELDPKKENESKIIKIPKNGYLLKARKFYLGASLEIINSNNFIPIIHAKSGIARLGLFVHVTADLIDIGYTGRITFQLFPVNDIFVYPGMKIGQVTFWKPKGKISLYQGKYNNSLKPQISKSYKDFKGE